MNPLQMIWTVFLDTAPFMMLGLFLAGWLKVLLRTESVSRFLGRPNLRSAFFAALFGAPLPVCSCGVLPVSLGLRDKGISREANLSLLISTPETGVNSIAVSWGLLGPLMTVFRVAAAFVSAMFAAVLSIAHRTDRSEENGDKTVGGASCTSAPAGDPPADDSSEDDGKYVSVGIRGFWRSVKAEFSGTSQKAASADKQTSKIPAENTEAEQPEKTSPDGADAPVPLARIIKDALHYGFVRVFEDIALWLVIGIVLAGLIAALVPNIQVEQIPGGNLSVMLIMLAASIPMYVCAVESTPLAAIFILKGVSPGAALVFLLAGPATNLTSALLIRKNFGRSFFRIYLASIVSVTLAAGLGLDALLSAADWQINPRVNMLDTPAAWTVVSYMSAFLLIGLIGFSFFRLIRRSRDASPRGLLRSSAGVFRTEPSAASNSRKTVTLRARIAAHRRPLSLVGVILLLGGYFASGIYTIAPGNSGFHILLGKIVEADIGPGLHYHLPRPFARVEIYRTEETRKTDLGFRTDISLLKRLRKDPYVFEGSGWHSFFTNMYVQPIEASYLLGDENQLEAKFSINYRVRDAHAFYYRQVRNADLPSLVLESVLREYMSTAVIDEVLTTKRAEIEKSVIEEAQALLDTYHMGIEILGIYTVDLHPPQDAVEAFRDVASAMEERETLIHNAYAARESGIPISRGEAEMLRAEAQAEALDLSAQSKAKAESFKMQSAAYSDFKDVTQLRMSLETMEKTAAGRQKIVMPDNMQGSVRLWDKGAVSDRPFDMRKGTN